MPVTVLGVGSNVLVRDGGVPGVVVRLGRGFADIGADEHEIICGAAALDLTSPTRPSMPDWPGWNSCAACRAPSAARCA